MRWQSSPRRRGRLREVGPVTARIREPTITPPAEFLPPAGSAPGGAHGPRRGRLRDGIYLVGKSWSFLREEPRMLLLPAVSTASLLVLAGLLGPPLASLNWQHTSRPALALIAAAATIPFIIVSTFFNVAFAATVQTRLRGGTPSIRSGLARARWRLPQIIGWAIVAAAVGLVMRLLENVAGGGLVARLAEWLGGLLWAAATFFVVPVIALEGYGPIESVRYSARVFKRHFGSAVTGTLTIGVVFSLAALPAGVVAAIGLAELSAHRPAVAIPALAVAFSLFAAVMIASQAVGSVFRVALYRQATEERVVGPFDEDDLARALRPRKRRR